MDIDKLLHFIQGKALYMSPMKQFIDTQEGTFTRATLEMFDKVVGYSGTETLEKQNQEDIDQTFVSCWHINERESFTMWNEYTTSCYSAVVQTTVKQLRDALDFGITSIVTPIQKEFEICGISNDASDIRDRYHIKIGKVNYIDEDRIMSSFNAFETIFSKRIRYQHENELRAVIYRKISASIAKGVNTGDKLPNWNIEPLGFVNSIAIHPQAGNIFEKQIRGLFPSIAVIESQIK